MIISFDTANTSQTEARGLVAFLSNLFQIEAVQMASFDPNSYKHSPLFAGVANQTPEVPAQEPVSAREAPASETSVAVDISAKRHRRTKAEIAADEAAELQAPVPTETATLIPRAVTAEELRGLLNAYIAKTSMEDAIGKLREFGCTRVSDALALKPADLNLLVEAIRG